ATGSKLASFVALMKVFLHALQPWSHPSNELLGPGWLGVIAVVSAVTMTYGNFAALAQRNLKRMLAYSSIANAGYMLVGVAAASVSTRGAEAAGSVLFFLVVYAFANIGAFAVAAWLVRDKKTDDIDDLNGLGMQSPLLAICILVLMLSLIGIPPFAGFFGKLYMFMEALNQQHAETRLTLMGLVALGLMNSVVSAFYYVRVLKAMFLREPGGSRRLGLAGGSIEIPIAIGALVAIFFGIYPSRLMSVMQAAAAPMLTTTSGGFASMISVPSGTGYTPLPPAKASAPASPKSTRLDPEQAKKYADRMKRAEAQAKASASPGAQPKNAPSGQPKNALAKKAEAQNKDQ
ncbi:MAG: proton-conducting transporter transmembrane domain-containing protein, partial [Isosphaeraceae bacterium]